MSFLIVGGFDFERCDSRGADRVIIAGLLCLKPKSESTYEETLDLEGGVRWAGGVTLHSPSLKGITLWLFAQAAVSCVHQLST